MFNNKFVQILIVGLIIFGICWIAKVNFSAQVGSSGIHVGMDRGSQ